MDWVNKIQFPAGAMKGQFLFATAFRGALGPAQHPIQWVPGAPSTRIKQPGHEPNH